MGEVQHSLAEHGESADVKDRHHTFVAFRYGQRFLAVPFECARRVVRLETFSPLPGAVPVLPGATNVDGHVVAVLDVGPLIGEPAISPRAGLYLVVVSDGNLEAGLLTSQMPTLHEVPEPWLQQETKDSFIKATYGWPSDRPVHVVEVLAVSRILAAAQRAYE